jgi:hypothetical protein
MFDPHPGNPNSVLPNKRVVSSMSPAIVSRDGKPFLGIGTPGGVRIFGSVMQAIMNVIDHGMTLQEAVEAPRLWTQGQEVELEQEFGEGPSAGMSGLGHPVLRVANVAGGMNGILIDHERGLMTGAACWRADGVPAGLSGGPAKVLAGLLELDAAQRRQRAFQQVMLNLCFAVEGADGVPDGLRDEGGGGGMVLRVRGSPTHRNPNQA